MDYPWTHLLKCLQEEAHDKPISWMKKQEWKEVGSSSFGYGSSQISELRIHLNQMVYLLFLMFLV